MALDPLATAADLQILGVDVSNTLLVDKMLAAASAAVRDAAGVPITRATSTIVIPGSQGQYLWLPGQPVVSVSEVLIDGEAVTDYKLVGGALWRACGWRDCEPVNVTVTQVHGLLKVPEDIVELAAHLAIAGMRNASEPRDPGVKSEAIDDHRTEYDSGADATVSVLELPPRTKQMLATRFGGGAYVTSER